MKSVKPKSSRIRSRTKGVTVTELLVSSVLMGVAMAVLGEMMVLLTIQASKNNNRWTAMDNARIAIQRISNDVRQAGAFGDTYAKPSSNNRKQFPAPDNPVYGSGVGTIFILNPQTLIIQSPTFYTDEKNYVGGPSYDKNAPRSPYNVVPMKIAQTDVADTPILNRDWDLNNVDTTIYQVVEDSSNIGNWKMVRSFFPGARIQNLPTENPTAARQVIRDQTVVTNIVGPFPKSGATAPQVFSYFYRDAFSGKIAQLSTTTFSDQEVDLLRGVGVDLEISKAGDSSGVGKSESLGIHHESFLRSNISSPRLNYKGSEDS